MCSFGINRKHDLFIISRKEKITIDAESMRIFDEDSEAYEEEVYN